MFSYSRGAGIGKHDHIKIYFMGKSGKFFNDSIIKPLLQASLQFYVLKTSNIYAKYDYNSKGNKRIFSFHGIQ